MSVASVPSDTLKVCPYLRLSPGLTPSNTETRPGEEIVRAKRLIKKRFTVLEQQEDGLKGARRM